MKFMPLICLILNIKKKKKRELFHFVIKNITRMIFYKLYNGEIIMYIVISINIFYEIIKNNC